MQIDEFYKRLRIGLTLLAGILAGKWAAIQAEGPFGSELFIGGCGVGVVAMWSLFALLDSWKKDDPE